MSFVIDQNHTLDLDDARERVRAFGDYLSNKHGIGVTWTSANTAAVRGKFLVVTIDATVTVEATRVHFEGKDPGMLWRGKAKDYIAHKLAKYLDPSTALTELPRR
jgi:hypothetical protein